MNHGEHGEERSKMKNKKSIMPSKFILKIKKTIEQHGLLSRGDTVIIALSGGADSMALFEILTRLRETYDLTLIPAHLNHGFRGAEAEGDRAFCEAEAARRGLSLVSEFVDIPALLEGGGSVQERARQVRYDFLYRTAKRFHAGRIALGHHADDQAETLLMRLLRGAGTRGLAGIPLFREPGILRPLLQVTRREIIDFLRAAGISWREDGSNKKTIYLRNRIRRELLPLLKKEYNPNLVKDLCRTAEIFREEEEFLAAEAAQHFHPLPLEGGIALSCDRLSSLPVALLRRVIRQALCSIDDTLQGGNFGQVEAVIRLMKSEGSSSRIDLPGGMQVRKVYDRLEFLRTIPVDGTPGVHEIPVPGTGRVPALGIEVKSEILGADGMGIVTSPAAALLDYDKCMPPLRVRTRRPGDRFRPSGFGKTKKVKRFLIDEKIPFPRRDRLPLFVNGRDEILWIGGVRTDARFVVGEGTTRVLHLSMRHLEGGESIDAG